MNVKFSVHIIILFFCCFPYFFLINIFHFYLVSHRTETLVFVVCGLIWCKFLIYCEGLRPDIDIFLLWKCFSLWRRQNAEVLIRSFMVQNTSIWVEAFQNELKLKTWRNYRRNLQISIEVRVPLIFVLFCFFLLLTVSSWFWFELPIWFVAFVCWFDGLLLFVHRFGFVKAK